MLEIPDVGQTVRILLKEPKVSDPLRCYFELNGRFILLTNPMCNWGPDEVLSWELETEEETKRIIESGRY